LDDHGDCLIVDFIRTRSDTIHFYLFIYWQVKHKQWAFGENQKPFCFQSFLWHGYVCAWINNNFIETIYREVQRGVMITFILLESLLHKRIDV
jgi:hypothetical protein